MELPAIAVRGKGSFNHGIHPPERKELAAEAVIEVMPPPSRVVLPLLQNIGAPCEPIVKPRQKVAYGDMVGKGKAFVSATLHSPINGIVQRSVVTTLPNGRHLPAMVIKADGDQLTGQALWEDIYGGPWPHDCRAIYAPDTIAQAIHKAGIVGLGGAAFPTHVKIMPNEKLDIDTLIVNGCECEPYLTTDYRLMLEAPRAIVAGALLAGRAVGAKQIIIGVEDNKPRAIESLMISAEGSDVQIAVVKTKYPQGSEKQLIKALLNRVVPLGALPSAVGVALSNVATVAAVARGVVRGKALTHRVVCVTGAGIVQPKNVLVALGTSVRELVDYCGGLREDAARMVAGGPMMGFAFTHMDTPVTKGSSGLTVLTRDDVQRGAETACVRCGRCVDVCPMQLAPTRLAMAARYKKWDVAERFSIMACFECGSCAYICPAQIPLVQLIRAGKATVAAAGKK